MNLPHLDPDLIQLSLEQQVLIETIKWQIPQMSRGQLEERLLQMTQLAEARQAVIRAMVKGG
ncbi:NblA/ycf18 family protein [Synechococcus sp. PCC 6312]|uniref:NblA/ycf18 family protein n=1 Tax=Synechococcus sp. (strain ATCC 27167 / PCC 6312) TaxID=195253 RepID=UPI00029F19F2|nr:NblA/ycf18 family protein [Synechococcus sp. PCC 6312]AFY60335.1 Phycobilisome degradation protein nblA [Synechococcus sp. PCC 6312]